MAKCNVSNCENKSKTAGLCSKHYTRLLRYGNVCEVRKPRGEARKFYLELVNRKDEGCIYWPFTFSGKSKRAWVQLPDGRRGYVARFLCEDVNGDPPKGKYHAAHNCGNATCVNPTHLRWATPVENAADKLIHGTHVNGAKQGGSKLSENDVLSIRERKQTPKQMAEIYGVKLNQIYRILRREHWHHI